MGKLQTVVDERGRILIPQELREEIGLTEGTVVEVTAASQEQAILVTAAGKKHRSWNQLNGIKPNRTKKPEWPSPEEIKSIWE